MYPQLIVTNELSRGIMRKSACLLTDITLRKSQESWLSGIQTNPTSPLKVYSSRGAGEYFAVPTFLDKLVLSEADRKKLMQACIHFLSQPEKNCNVLERIRKLDDHVAFYELLRLPENHINSMIKFFVLDGLPS